MRVSAVAWLVIGLFCVGCGRDGQLPTAKVKRIVKFAGHPVTGGAVTFVPQGQGSDPGQAATGMVQSDGSFALTTYQVDDGAVIGPHSVRYAAPPGELPPGKTEWESGEEPTKSKYADLQPANPQVEIKKGPNELVIDLVQAK